jgi:hypothetical protein
MSGRKSIAICGAPIIIAMIAVLSYARPLEAAGKDVSHSAVAGEAGAASGESGKNLLLNGDLSRGSGEACDGWRHDGWILTPSTTTFNWVAPKNGQPGELAIVNHGENDARWVQSISLPAGWYYISTEARGTNIRGVRIGANISLLEDGIVSNTFLGSSGWRRLGFYLKVGKGGADVDVALRLGGFTSVAGGEAAFRDPSVVRITGPPPPGTPYVYDLSAIRRSEGSAPVGHFWTLPATFVLLIVLAIVGWRLYGESIPQYAAQEKISPKRSKTMHRPKSASGRTTAEPKRSRR